MKSWSAPEPTLRRDSVFQRHRALVTEHTNHKGVKAAEVLEFGPDGLVHRAGACHMDVNR